MNLLIYVKPAGSFEHLPPGSVPTDEWVAQNSPTMQKALEGDSVWVFGRRDGNTYLLYSRIIVATVSDLATEPFGRYRIDAGPGTILFVEDNQPDLGPRLRELSITINCEYIAHSFRGTSAVRGITEEDHEKLVDWSRQLTQL
jgi:hypothetical protein